MKKCGELAYGALLPGVESLMSDSSMIPMMTTEERGQFYEGVVKDFHNLEYKGEIRQYDP